MELSPWDLVEKEKLIVGTNGELDQYFQDNFTFILGRELIFQKMDNSMFEEQARAYLQEHYPADAEPNPRDKQKVFAFA